MENTINITLEKVAQNLEQIGVNIDECEISCLSYDYETYKVIITHNNDGYLFNSEGEIIDQIKLFL